MHAEAILHSIQQQFCDCSDTIPPSLKAWVWLPFVEILPQARILDEQKVDLA